MTNKEALSRFAQADGRGLPHRLLVADVDGTLTEGGAPVPPSVTARVAAFQKRGGLFTLATGRGPQAARSYLDRLGVNIPAILLNGSLLFDPASGRSLDEHFLDPALMQDLLDWLEDTRPDALVYQGGEALVTAVTGPIAEHLAKDGAVCREIARWRDLSPHGVFKILLIAPAPPTTHLTGRYRETGERITWVNSEPTYWEVLPEGISKGTGLAALCRRLGLSPADAVAVGDGLNDLEMIRLAGMGVAVANAAPALKSAAARVTASRSSQGVTELLDYILE